MRATYSMKHEILATRDFKMMPSNPRSFSFLGLFGTFWPGFGLAWFWPGQNVGASEMFWTKA